MKRLLFLALPLLLAGSAAQAKTSHSKLTWMNGPDSLPSGSRIAVVSGDPAKKGPFTIELMFPANYTVPPHHHPTTEKVTVLSGRMSLGMGDKLDKAKAKSLAPGKHATMPANMNHYGFTGSSGATIQVASTGPFQIIYVDPKDDPRKK
jgi:quercetin dioxygenase-like cupin family protein